MADFFLDELIRHEGLGDDIAPTLACKLCSRVYTDGAVGPDAVRLFKCRQCGEFLQCKDCCVHGHARTPLHPLKVVCSSHPLPSKLLIDNRSGGEISGTKFRYKSWVSFIKLDTAAFRAVSQTHGR